MLQLCWVRDIVTYILIIYRNLQSNGSIKHIEQKSKTEEGKHIQDPKEKYNINERYEKQIRATAMSLVFLCLASCTYNNEENEENKYTIHLLITALEKLNNKKKVRQNQFLTFLVRKKIYYLFL